MTSHTLHVSDVFSQERRRYQPLLPKALTHIECLQPAIDRESMVSASSITARFPTLSHKPFLTFRVGDALPAAPLQIGVVFSGGQAAGGHNVIAGLFDAMKRMHRESRLVGFLGGPSGIVQNTYQELSTEKIAPFRNMGGFDLIGSGRTKIEKIDQLDKASAHCAALGLDGLVIIGGDDSNTNAALLAEHFYNQGCSTAVVGVPKTIDGDLKNQWIESSFGFDTACKTYAHTIGNICRDALSAKKYTHFIRLMGRSASHIALECALQTHPNITLIGEEIAEKRLRFQEVTSWLADCVMSRAEKGKTYGVFLLPEGVIEFIAELKGLIEALNRGVAQQGRGDPATYLAGAEKAIWDALPPEISAQLLLDRDPHGNVQLSRVATEELFIHSVQQTLRSRGYIGAFQPIGHFLGYEGRCAYPSYFDTHYCYALGFVAALLVRHQCSGYMGAIQGLEKDPGEWRVAGIPLPSMMDMEERSGLQKPVIKKSLVDLAGEPFTYFAAHREEWALHDHYSFPGPIQFAGRSATEITATLTLEKREKRG